KCALGFQRNAVDFVEQDNFSRRQRSKLRDQLSGGRIDHLESDNFSGLQVGAPLKAGEFGITDGSQNNAEKCLTDAGNTANQQVTRIHLPVLLFIVSRWNLRE